MPSTARKARERSDNSTEAVTRLSEMTDKMHALLVARADELVGCTENQPGGARIGGAHRHHRSIRTAAVAAWPNSRRQRIAAVPNAHRAFAVELSPTPTNGCRTPLRLARPLAAIDAATLPTSRWWRGARGKSWRWRGSSRRRPGA